MATGYKKDLDEKQSTDEKYNPSGAARDLYGRETDDSVFDDIEKNYHKDADSSQENANISKAKKSSNENRDEVSQKEDLGGRWKTKYTGGDTTQSPNSKNILKNFKLGDLRKKGPLGALIGLLVAGTVGIGGFLSPALLVDNVMNLFTNNFNDAHPALTVRTRVNMANKISDTRNSFSETSDGKCGIRCKHTTMSDAMVRNLESKGYKVTPDASNARFGRRIVNTMTLPNGTVIHNGDEFKKAMRDPINASMFNHVYNSKTRYFLNSKFGSMLKSKLGINKAYKLAGDSKEKFNASLRKALNLPPITVDPNAPTQTREERLRANPHFASAMKAIDGMGKISKPTNVVAGSCLAVNTSKMITASVKYAKYSAYAALVMTYLNAASKARAADGGGIDWLVMSELGNRLTYVDTNKTTEDGKPNELYGLSATNSYGYNAVAYGDSGKMPDYAKADSMESSGILAALGGLAFFSTTDPTARTAASTVCRGADSIFAVFIQCAPTAPTVVGYGACIAGDVLTGVVIGEVLKAALPVILAAVVDANLKDIDENTKGPELGNALYPGSAAILGGQAASYGMKAGNKDEIDNYLTLTNDVLKEDEAIARLDAKKAPLDIYNQYSFLGSMAKSINLASFTNSSLTKSASLMTALIPRSLATLTTNSNAGTFMPLNKNKVNQYGQECAALNSIGVAGDAFCMPAYTKSVEELNADIEANLSYMIDNKYIDEETGAPLGDEPDSKGKEFQKFLDNCVYRIDALGETTQPLQAGDIGDYEWFIGAKCNEETDMVRNFRIYAMDEPVNAELIGEDTVLHSSAPIAGEAAGGDTTNSNSGNVVADGWSFPTTAGAQLTPMGAFGPRGELFHTGIDLGVGAGSPFYATRDGVIETKEYNIYSINGGAWCPVAPSNISDPNQKDMWITHEVDGQTYTSVYAHMSRYLKKTGDVVKAGDLIGYTGGSGCSDAPHVHFEIWQGVATPSIEGPGMQDPWPLINH